MWHKKIGLFVVLGLVVFIFLAAAEFSKESIDNIYFWLPLSLAILIVIILWFKGQMVRKCPKNKIGIIIAIKCEPSFYEELKFKFIDKIKEGISPDLFHLQILPQYIANEITTKTDALTYLEKSKSTLIIYGSCQQGVRKVNNKSSERFEVNLKSIVLHGPVEQAVSDTLKTELADLIPQVSLDKADQLGNYQVTTQWLVTCSKYFTGVSNLISNDLDTAITVFEDLDNDLDGVRLIQPIAFMKKRTRSFLSSLYMTKCMIIYHDDFRSTWDIHVLEQVYDYAKKTREFNTNNLGCYHFLAIYSFWKNRDIVSARRWLSNIKDPNDALKLYSLAFLAAYEGKITESLRHYKRAFRNDQHEATLIEVEQFIATVLEQEPDKYHLYLCLALINEHKEDYGSAEEDLNKFMERAKSDEELMRNATELSLRLTSRQVAISDSAYR